MLEIIYKDKNFIIAIKKPGMLAEESGNTLSIVSEAKKTLDALGENSEIYTVHRLDKPVGGLTILARNKKTASYFTDLIANGEITKNYVAVIYGKPQEESGIYTDLLFRDAKTNKTFVTDRQRKGTRDAKLSYALIDSVKDDKSGKELSLVKIRLYTGRTHQIRVQFASRKTPLVGDGRYGSRDSKDLPALFSHSLSFFDISGKEVSISALPENVYPWNLFDLGRISEKDPE